MNRGYFQKLLFILAILLPAKQAEAQSPWEALGKRPSNLHVENGTIDVATEDFTLKLLRSSQTLSALSSKLEPGFDFTPGERLNLRSKDGLYHLGDLNLRLRAGADAVWKLYSTAAKRMDVASLTVGGKVLAAANLAATLPADIPLRVIRYWEKDGKDLVLRFEIKNTSNSPVEIGALGIPMIFNNILHEKTLEQTHASNVFYDPYIGRDAGYLQVCRLKGNGPVLLVLPAKNASFEAYNPLLDDPTPRGITFEGFHEWMIHSKAYAENEWKNAQPWNQPTSTTLAAGESKNYALKFTIAESVKKIEAKLLEEKRPVAVGIPGYVISQNIPAKLFLNYSSKVLKTEVFPEGSLAVAPVSKGRNGWRSYQVTGKVWGRSRLSVTYANGLTQTVHYKVIQPEEKVLSNFGKFLTSEQWYKKDSDPFKRSESVISYDYETKKQVTEDNRVWIAGLSDEGGAGGWLAAIMKQLVQPEKAEVEKLQRFVNHTLWGNLQVADGDQKYGVKKSLFYYEPDKMPAGTYSKDINYKVWSAWPQKEAFNLGRSYNYPHVAAAHWVFYRLARFHKALVTEHSWDLHLKNAFHTSIAMVELAPHYAQFGQMEGSVFLYILKDLKAEGYNDLAEKLETEMKKRADLWKSLSYPFGSEMPWDSTGQEEVYMWSDYFGYNDKSKVTLDAILAYMPTVPHWGYNGSARRYWDFLYGGKLSRVERQLHHYGSGLNAIPVLQEYRKNPEDLYLLRVGYGGLMGAVSNITEDGFGSAAFHSFPSTLKIDALSGDYGSNFYGYAVNTSSYILNDKQLGWLAFGGLLEKSGKWINTKITTAAKSKVFIAPAGLWLTLDAGKVEQISYNINSGEVLLSLAEDDGSTPSAYLQMEQMNKAYKYSIAGNYPTERGRIVVPLGEGKTSVSLRKEN
ncbi:DUF5695 domain-containing protein [Desertivirga arenae]|uniref:DUF5695 domain-containing protein n=1 Tax=Desertivirga arenae TaxID=2810309 RepID=UPI001A9609C8|nr:DUF5695 domain-containing protein [Pedobacter sp. SYSU D00823]